MLPSSSAAPRRRRTLSSTLIDESVAAAAELVQKWHPDDTPTSTSCSLFLHFDGDHNLFLDATADLHRAMLFFASNDISGSIVQAQELLQTAMRRLDLELRLLLHHLDDDDDHHHHHRIQGQAQEAATPIVISRIVRAMMAAGYGKECLSTYKSSRRTTVATKLQRLLPGGLHNSNLLNLNKHDWDQVDATVIQPWLAVASMVFNSLFRREKELCDSVFAGDHASSVGEAVFAAITNDHATNLLVVAEAAVARAHRAPERLFRVLDVHNTLADEVLPAILSVFNNNNNNNKGRHQESEITTRVVLVIAKAAEAARDTLVRFEAAILHKEPSKGTTSGGAVHPLTRYVMNYLVFLAEDYSTVLVQQLDTSVWICRLVSALTSKLESKAGSYRREAALSYLFMANNTHYVAKKVRGCGKLQAILGDSWAEEHRAKARGHVQVYTRAVWGKVISSTASIISRHHPPREQDDEGEGGGGGGDSFEQVVGVQTGLVMEAVAMQDQWMAADDEMAGALRLAAREAVVPKYRMFYRRYGAALTLTPGDVTTMIAALFTGHHSSTSQPEEV